MLQLRPFHRPVWRQPANLERQTLPQRSPLGQFCAMQPSNACVQVLAPHSRAAAGAAGSNIAQTIMADSTSEGFSMLGL